MEIEPITKQNLEICVDIIFESELGRRYYPTRNLLKNKIEQSHLEDSIYLAKEEGDYVGVLWYQRKGMFCQYPYLHIIVLTESCCGRGYGKKLMEFYEYNLAYVHKVMSLETKLFLLVGDYNHTAKRFYEKLGYTEQGRIPHLFRRGITEILMMKELRLSDVKNCEENPQ